MSMKVIRLHDENNSPIYLHCEDVTWFRENNEGPRTLTEIHLGGDGSTVLKVRENVNGVRDALCG